MTTEALNPKASAVIDKATSWQEEYRVLRQMALDCGLTEDFKWGWPCYTHNGGNVVLIHGFKDYCAYLFFKGALMKDPENLLIQQTDNVQSARQIRFTSLDQIKGMDNLLKTYLHEAIAVEAAGLKVEMKKTTDFAMPDELRARLDADAGLKAAFEALTPGRQRGYLLHFASAKQAKTREARIDKCTPRILAGKGLDD